MFFLERNTVPCGDRCLPSLAARGCIVPAPIHGQCSFPRNNATVLCGRWSRCRALNCNVYRTDCQARATESVEPSFGEADAYVATAPPRRSLSTGAERRAYRRRFDDDYFLSDAMYVYRRFFRSTPAGFFIESGALDGSVFGSNSYFYERYLGWSGLLVEPSTRNFDRLRHRRGGVSSVQLVHTALCSTDGWTTISSSGGCCGKAGGGNERVPCTSMRTLIRTHNVSIVDFWSLDVEGGELDVLTGMDWDVPTRVILIESVTPAIRTLLLRRAFRRETFWSKSRLNEIWVNTALEHNAF